MTLGFVEGQVPAKVPDHAINLGPSKAVIELLGSRLTANEPFDYGVHEPSQNVKHDVTRDEQARNEAVSHGYQGDSSHFVSQEPD